MSELSSKDYIDEIVKNIASQDLIKAEIILSSSGDLDESTKIRLAYELNKAEPPFVATLLGRLLSRQPAAFAANSKLKPLLISKAAAAPEAVAAILADPILKDKLAIIEIAGSIQAEELALPLCRLLTSTNDSETICASVLALGEIGAASSVNTVAELLYSIDRTVILSAVEALRRMSSTAAVQRLAERLGADREVDAAILSAFAAIQTPHAMEKLRDGLLSQHASIRNACKSKLVAIGAKAVPILTENLRQEDPDILVHSLNALGEIGDPSATNAIRKLIQSSPDDPNVRFAAYEALGRLPFDRSMYVLASGLADPVDNVRVAAAKAINRCWSETLSAGVSNLLHDPTVNPQKIVEAILMAEAEDIFTGLLPDDFFRKCAMAYLKSSAHGDLQRLFESILRRKGESDLADSLKPSARPRPVGRMVYAVDDSIMILRIYRSVLHELGYESELFEFPEGAIDRIRLQPPDFLVTDLNMPKMSGVELAQRVRRNFTSDKLPILMVTTQADSLDHDAARQAGVDLIIQKPFTADSLGDALTTLLIKSKRGGA